MAQGSGWTWQLFGPSPGEKSWQWKLITQEGRTAASVFAVMPGQTRPAPHKFIWWVWDRDGVGGENSWETTLERAKDEAVAAAIRWDKHPAATP